ncbi:MAG: FHA domain-containing protein [Myxococcales bacterium]
MAVDTSSPKTEMIDPALLEGVSANFIVKAPSGLEKAYPMRQMTLTIGRSDQCDISVKDSSMSGRHAEIKKSDGDITIRDLGSANGIYLNGERIEEAELYDGDVLRLGQTSIRIDVVGGRARAGGGLPLRTVALAVAGILVFAAIGVGVGIAVRKKQQHRRDLRTVAAFVAAAREGQRAKPCAAIVDKVQDVAKELNALGKLTCAEPLHGDEARRTVVGYRDLSRTYQLIATAVSQFAGQQATSTQALTGAAEQLVDLDLKLRVAEAQELIDQRSQVAVAFSSDWKKLSAAANTYASDVEQAFVFGNKASCPAVDRGVQARSPSDVLISCNKGFDRAKNAVEDSLKELEELSGGEVPE